MTNRYGLDYSKYIHMVLLIYLPTSGSPAVRNTPGFII